MDGERRKPSSPTGRFMQLLSSKLSPLVNSRQQEDSYLRRLELTNVFKLYFDFAYYLGASPFRLVMDDGNGYYSLKMWRPQQCICGFLHLLGLFKFFSEIREGLPDDWSILRKNPAPYFHIVLGFCIIFYKLITQKNFWLRKETYLKIVNVTLKEKYLPVRNHWVMKSSFLYILFISKSIKVVSSFITGYSFVIPISKLTPSWWLRRLVAHGRYVFSFSKKLEPTEAPEFSSISFWDGITTILVALAEIQRLVMGEFCDLCILAAALTLWTTANSFANDINDMLQLDEEWDNQTENGDLPQIITVRGVVSNQPKARPGSQPWRLIYKNFQAIQNLSGIINAALGSQVTWYMAEALMYYSINLNSVLLTNDEYQRFHKGLFYLLTFVILYVSADICNKVESVKEWLVKSNNIKTVPNDEANLVLHEIIVKDIGIRGSNIFTLTFPMVAGYLTLIVTFFVICVQQSDTGVD